MKTLTTSTAEGFIYHKKWRGILLPVKLNINNQKGQAGVMNEVQPPKRERGDLIFALPGGDQLAEWEI